MGIKFGYGMLEDSIPASLMIQLMTVQHSHNQPIEGSAIINNLLILPICISYPRIQSAKTSSRDASSYHPKRRNMFFFTESYTYSDTNTTCSPLSTSQNHGFSLVACTTPIPDRCPPPPPQSFTTTMSQTHVIRSLPYTSLFQSLAQIDPR